MVKKHVNYSHCESRENRECDPAIKEGCKRLDGKREGL